MTTTARFDLKLDTDDKVLDRTRFHSSAPLLNE
jgi:hypothetical protein